MPMHSFMKNKISFKHSNSFELNIINYYLKKTFQNIQDVKMMNITPKRALLNRYYYGCFEKNKKQL